MTSVDDAVRILLIRHGQQVRHGADGPLTDLGEAQARATAPAVGLADGDRLVSSSLRRAVRTATALGRAPEQLADLDEFRFGPQWSWTKMDDREDLALWQPGHRPDGGPESLRDFQSRVQDAVHGLLREPPSGRLVIVVHAGVIDALVRWAFGLGPDDPWTTDVAVAHASITELDHWPRGRHAAGAPRHTLLHRLGDVSHLAPELVTGR